MDIKKAAKILKALSHPNRLELFLELAKKQPTDFQTGDQCLVAEIMNCLNVGAPTVCHHLKELTNADLIITQRRGKFLTAKINKATIDEVRALLDLNSE